MMKSILRALAVTVLATSCRSIPVCDDVTMQSDRRLDGPFIYVKQSAKRDGYLVLTDTKTFVTKVTLNGQTHTNALFDHTVEVFCESNLVYSLSECAGTIERQFHTNAVNAVVFDTDENKDGIPEFIVISTPEQRHAEVIVRDSAGDFVPAPQEKIDYLRNEDRHSAAFRIMVNQKWLLGIE